MPTPQTFIYIINQLLPEPHAGLLAGMLFGKSARLPKDFIEMLRVTGTLHMIALSGTNVIIIIRIFGTIFMPFGRRIASLLNLIWIFLFVSFVGPSPSVVRAALMGGLALIAAYAGRPYYGLLSLALAIGVVGIITPAWYGDVGFQLSVLATMGIIVSEKVDVSMWLRKRLGKLTQGPRLKGEAGSRFKIELMSTLGEGLKSTLAAQLFTLPVLVFTFHRISLVAPLTNLLVGFVVPPIMVLGILLLCISLIYLPLGQLCAWTLWALLEYFIKVVEFTSKIPFAQLTW